MRLLFIGDIVGTPGVNFVRRALPALIARERLDLVIANAENAAGGAGLAVRLYKRPRGAGGDLMAPGGPIHKKAGDVATPGPGRRPAQAAHPPPPAAAPRRG